MYIPSGPPDEVKTSAGKWLLSTERTFVILALLNVYLFTLCPVIGRIICPEHPYKPLKSEQILSSEWRLSHPEKLFWNIWERPRAPACAMLALAVTPSLLAFLKFSQKLKAVTFYVLFLTTLAIRALGALSGWYNYNLGEEELDRKIVITWLSCSPGKAAFLAIIINLLLWKWNYLGRHEDHVYNPVSNP